MLKIDTWGNLDLLHNEDHKSAPRDLFLVFSIRNLTADASRKSKQLCREGKIQRSFAHTFVPNKFYTLNFTAIVYWLLFVPHSDVHKSQPNPRWNIQEQLTVTVPSCTCPRQQT